MHPAKTIALLLLTACPPSTETGDTARVQNWLDDSGDADTDADADSDTDIDVDCDGDLACERCDEGGFYGVADGLGTPADVRTALRAEMTGFSTCVYAATTEYMFLTLDNQDEAVECVYTGRVTQVVDEKPDSSTDMNTEHTWPQSLGASEVPAKCDLHHLHPSDVDANQARASHPYGLVTGSVDWSEGGSRLGSAGGDQVFEPRAAKRGDIARGMLYFATQYDHTLTTAEKNLYVSWHAADPVDDDEFARTIAIKGRQGHANPYVACPELVNSAW